MMIPSRPVWVASWEGVWWLQTPLFQSVTGVKRANKEWPRVPELRQELNWSDHSMPKKQTWQEVIKTISTTMKLETLGHLLSPLYQWERELLESGICSFATEWFLIPKDLKKKNEFKEVHKGHLEIEKFHRGISCTIICPQTNYDIIKALRFAQRFVKYAKMQDKWSETFSGDTEKLPAWNKASIDLLKLTKKRKKMLLWSTK